MPALDRVKALLDRKGIRNVLVPITSRLARSHDKGVKRIFYDDGIWMHATAKGYFAYHQPYVGLDMIKMEEAARENFFWGYRPREEDVVVDIGAGVGEEALIFSRAVGPRGKVVCVEAHPRTYRCLQKLVEYNDLENVVCMHRAVAGNNGSALIEDSRAYLGNRLNSPKGIAVRAVTVDALVEELGLERIHFLKMNIEGAERLAILGMGETLKRTEVLCISCHDFLASKAGDDSLRTKDEITQFIRQNGMTMLERGDPKPYLRDQVWAWNPEIARDYRAPEMAARSA